MSEKNNSAITMIEGRRSFLTKGSTMMLSGAALAMMAGAGGRTLIGEAQASENDVTILNAAVSTEYEAIAAYELGAASGLLSADALKLGISFRDHHREHVDALIATVQQLGGTPDEPLTDYGFPLDKLTDEAAVLRLAAGLEKGAVSAYLGAVPILDDRGLAKVAASILGDEAMHWAVLRGALGEDPVPVAFVE
ncbi:ferritin-like domain-containing protein [Parvibaculaceae bacterium PLY_AMNH_Bact1]|nr:ferritin-like domain-containing protein [Parvibaculaceae bacterium PLY_AMNH_Bact1]